MPAFSYLMPDNDSAPTVQCTQEELDQDWLSMWKRLGDTARSCPDISSKEETIDMWLDSWHSAMAELQDLDSKTESARLRPVKPSPLLEKLILDVHKKCKQLEDPLMGWDDELLPNFNRKPASTSKPEATGNPTGNKGKHSLKWCMGGIPAQDTPKPGEGHTLTFPTVPAAIPPPSPLPPIRRWRHCYPPSCPPSPPAITPYVLKSAPARDSNTTSNTTSPTASPPLSADSSPRWAAPIIIAPPPQPHMMTRAPDSPRSNQTYTPSILSPPPFPRQSYPYIPYHDRPTTMSERELILLIESRQRDIELTQLEMSRKQSDINRAVADITSWLVELRHKRDGA